MTAARLMPTARRSSLHCHQPVNRMRIDPANMPATAAATMSGWFWTSCGPGTKPWIDSAARSNADEPLAGIPNPSVGMSSPALEAFWAASFAAMPCVEPRPNCSGVFEIIWACW